jgi:hypothetical protein
MKLEGARPGCDEGTPVRIVHEHVFLSNNKHGSMRTHDPSSNPGSQRLSADHGIGE